MMPKETFLAWLHNHGTLTADLEFDVHDCFDAAMDAAGEALAKMPAIGLLSRRKRLESFTSVCKHLDGRIAAGQLDTCEARVALSLMQAISRDFRKAAQDFLHHPPSTPEALPQSARDFLAANTDSFSPLVAG